MQMIATDNKRMIVGLGMTGLSCARYLASRQMQFTMVDSRQQPPELDTFASEFPDNELRLGDLQAAGLCEATELLVSPGVSLSEPAIAAAISQGVSIRSDIDLFREAVSAPIVAITGSNGKSTVTTLVGMLLQSAGKSVCVGGNIGVPVLSLLNQPEPDIYVLELSSFQLERCEPLNAEVATVLNMSPDHMDRYASMVSYHLAKHRIFRGCRQVVVNRADPLSRPLVPDSVKQWTFGLDQPDFGGFGLIQAEGESWLAFHFEPLVPVSSLKLVGRHNHENALAALAIVHALGVELANCLPALQQFEGLPHRCQFVAEWQSITFYNDSKGTNPGASMAAISGFAEGTVVLIAGGQGKDLDFSVMQDVVSRYCRALVVIGESAQEFEQLFSSQLPVLIADSMSVAVREAAKNALPGDTVLLSPACASFDMFDNYQHRGDCFIAAVHELVAGGGA